MTFLPIVVRELRVAARRKSTYRVRFWTAFFAILFSSYLVFVSGEIWGQMGGAIILSALAGVCFLSSVFLSGNTVDCISVEKRDGTLGFLFLTDLKGIDIALGKLFSTSLNSFYAILGVFPIVAVSLLLGGVRAIEIWKVALAVLNTFLFTHTAGILASTLCRKRAAAAGTSLVLIFGYMFGIPLLHIALRTTSLVHWASLFECLNPGYSVYWACDMIFRRGVKLATPSGHYWTSLLLVHLNAWFFLALASWWLPRCWQEKPAKMKVRWRDWFLKWYHKRYTPRQQLLDANPFIWLTIRERLGAVKSWCVLLLINCFWVCVLSQCPSVQEGLPVFAAVIIGNHLLLKIFVAAEAGEFFEEQRHNGAMEFLLSCTPLSVQEIVTGQWVALRRKFVQPIIVVLVIDFTIMLIGFFRTAPGFDSDEKYGFALFAFAAMVLLVADTIAMAWVGMWNGMSQKKIRHAAGATIGLLLIVPGVIFGLIEALCGLCHFRWVDSFCFVLLLWFIVGIAVDVPAFLFARQQLLTRFRAMVAPQIGEQPGLFGRLGRLLGTMAQPKPPRIEN